MSVTRDISALFDDLRRITGEGGVLTGADVTDRSPGFFMDATGRTSEVITPASWSMLRCRWSDLSDTPKRSAQSLMLFVWTQAQGSAGWLRRMISARRWPAGPSPLFLAQRCALFAAVVRYR